MKGFPGISHQQEQKIVATTFAILIALLVVSGCVLVYKNMTRDNPRFLSGSEAANVPYSVITTRDSDGIIYYDAGKTRHKVVCAPTVTAA